MSPFWQFFFARLQDVPEPTFAQRELERFAESEWQPLLADRVLAPAPMPEAILDSRGQLLEVRRVGDRLFGVEASDELPVIAPLAEVDVTAFRCHLSGLVGQLRQRNGIHGIPSKRKHGFIPLGRKSLADRAAVSVFLALGAPHGPSIEARLALLARARGTKVVVFPFLPDVDRLVGFEDDDLHLADLGERLRIEWPTDLIEPQRSRYPDYGFFRKSKKAWAIHYLGETIEAEHVVGMAYVAKALRLSPESIPLAEIEQELTLTAVDHRASGGLEARAEPNQNLPATSSETLKQLRDAVKILEDHVREAEEIDDNESAEAWREKLETVRHRISSDTHGGRIKVEGNETTRKRISKNLKKAYDTIGAKHAAIGRYIRQQAQLKEGRLAHSPKDGERWDVRF